MGPSILEGLTEMPTRVRNTLGVASIHLGPECTRMMAPGGGRGQVGALKCQREGD